MHGFTINVSDENGEFPIGITRIFDCFVRFDADEKYNDNEAALRFYSGFGGVSAGGSVGALPWAPLGLPTEATLSTLNFL